MKDSGAILDKIKKLLALATSPNAHEAAAALRRARELMDEHGINDEQLAFSDIKEEPLKRPGTGRPPRYEAVLVSTIAKAFGLRTLLGKGSWYLVGGGFRLEIGQYLAAMLLRKLRSARAAYLLTLKRCKRDTKIRRADEYCLGWVAVVSDKIARFATLEVAEAEASILQRYMDRYSASTGSFIDRVNRNGPLRDYSLGAEEGRTVEIRHGMQGGRQTLQLEGA
jgi:hypothetical protein